MQNTILLNSALHRIYESEQVLLTAIDRASELTGSLVLREVLDEYQTDMKTGLGRLQQHCEAFGIEIDSPVVDRLQPVLDAEQAGDRSRRDITANGHSHHNTRMDSTVRQDPTTKTYTPPWLYAAR